MLRIKACILFTTLATVLQLSLCGEAEMMNPPAQCNPDGIGDAPYQLQKVCAALNTIYRLSHAMEKYIEQEAPTQRSIQYLRAPLPNERFESSVKRQDLDHVFLRFGKRRRR